VGSIIADACMIGQLFSLFLFSKSCTFWEIGGGLQLHFCPWLVCWWHNCWQGSICTFVPLCWVARFAPVVQSSALFFETLKCVLFPSFSKSLSFFWINSQGRFFLTSCLSLHWILHHLYGHKLFASSPPVSTNTRCSNLSLTLSQRIQAVQLLSNMNAESQIQNEQSLVPKGPRLTQNDKKWESLREDVHRIYVTNSETLPTTMSEIEKLHSFKAS